MALSVREVKGNISVVKNIKQITSVMKLVAASHLKKSRFLREKTLPFFEEIKQVMTDILSHTDEIDNVFFDKREKKSKKEDAYLIISGDRGLAGSYNNNVIKLVKQHSNDSRDVRLMVAGHVGRSYFIKQKYNVDKEFNYPVQNPTIYRAREIATELMELFKAEEIDNVYIVYTKMISTINVVPKIIKLFPLDLHDIRHDLDISQSSQGTDYAYKFEYEPSVKAVFNVLVPKYVAFMVYFLLLESNTSENGARMTAMDNATSNAEEILKELQLDFNRARQFAITREMLEIISGSEAMG